MKQELPPSRVVTQQKLQSGLGAMVVVGAIAALYFARDILIPFAFALTLTFLLTPVVAFLERLRAGRMVSVLTTVLVSVALAGGIGWIIANQLVDVANQLPLYRQNIQAKIQEFHLPATGQLARAADSLNEIERELAAPGAQPQSNPTASSMPVPVHVVEPVTSGWTQLRELGPPVIAPLARVGMVFIFTVFMLLKREDLRNRLLRVVGLGQLNLTTEALDDASSRISKYILMQFLVNAGFGTLFGCCLYLLGVPNAILWAVVAAILRIVPYVGTLVAAILPIALSLAVFDGWLRPLLVFLLVACLELILANLIEPWLYGAHVGISSLALLVTSVFWAVLWGPAGLILSTPLTVCLVVLGRYVPQLSFLHILLGDEPVLAADARIYQRLLAMDQLEAQSIASQFLKSKPLVELYDELLIPALTMAEQDRHKGAIDAAREEFLFLSINEMVVELSENELSDGTSVEHLLVAAAARILCLPANDRADQITGAILAQLLEQKGLAVLSFPMAGASPQEWIEWLTVVDAGPSDVICISALPPYAFAPARAMCKLVRERFPKIRVIVCIWGFSGDTRKAMARFERMQPIQLCNSLTQAVKQIQELVVEPAELSSSAGAAVK